MSNLQLYSSFISSSSHTVRIALNLKGLDYEYKAVNLFRNEQHRPEYLKINPIGYVPALKDGDFLLADSFAIIMYLEEKYPHHPLLPRDLKKKAINYQDGSDKITGRFYKEIDNFLINKPLQEGSIYTPGLILVASIVTSSIQPLVTVPVLGYIKQNLSQDEKISWVHKHFGKGFAALENLLKDHAGKYATGDDIFLADIFLEPIINLSQRYNFDLSEFGLLWADDVCPHSAAKWLPNVGIRHARNLTLKPKKESH